jgi:hypothetical protein
MRTWIVLRGILAGFLVIFSGCDWDRRSNDANAIVIADNQKSAYQIVIPSNAAEVEKYAAAELQEFLYQITGARLPIVSDAEKTSSYEILVGKSQRFQVLETGIDFEQLGREGFTIRTHGRSLMIAGNSGRGTLYGVYAFLENYLGCRWFTSKVSHIPTRNKICLPPIQDTQVPVFDYREVYYQDAMDPVFAGRLRLNGNASQIVDNRMVAERHAGWATWCHTSFTFVPPDVYFESHPEYYAFSDGKRQAKQLCFTNPDLFGIVVENMRKVSGSVYFTPGQGELVQAEEGPVWADKENTYIDFSQQDHYGACDCQSCKAIDEREGSRMGSILTLVNRIADEFPDKTISTLSYVWSRTPPKHIRPAENVSIMLCNFEATRAMPMADSPFGQDKSFMRDTTQWAKICNKLFIWDYIVNFSHLYAPNPNFHIQQANIRFYIDHNVKGIFAQGSREAGGEFCELRNYLLAKLLWNPDADVDAVINEFLDGYYGPAGRPIRQYIDLMRETVIQQQTKLGIYDRPEQHRDGFLSKPKLEQYNLLFDQAEDSVRLNDELLYRVRTARMPLMYVQVVNGYGTAQERLELLKQFYSLCSKNGIRKLAEGGNTPEQFFQAQMARLKKEFGVTVSPPGGMFTDFQNVTVTLSSIQTDCPIHYTTDGSEPTEQSALYTGAINISRPCTLRANCFGEVTVPAVSVSFEKVQLPVQTGVIKKDDPAQYLKLNVQGANILRLLVKDGGNSTDCDHGDWALAKVIAPDGRAVQLGDLQPVKQTQGWGSLGIHTNIDGYPLQIGSTLYSSGVGTHANSELVYDLGGSYQYFEAYVGVDAGACEKGSVVFHVETE